MRHSDILLQGGKFQQISVPVYDGGVAQAGKIVVTANSLMYGGRGYAAYRTTEGGGGGYTGGNAALSSRSNEGTSFPAACSKPGTCFAIALGPTVKTRTIARVSQDTFGSVKITALD